MSTIGNKWREDGVVDTCNKDQIVTASNRLRNIDLQTFKKDEIPFEAEFNLQMKRDDYVNVSWNSETQKVLFGYLFCFKTHFLS